MRSWRAATLHLVTLAFFGSLAVATPIPLNVAALVAWALIVRGRARRWWRANGDVRLNPVVVIQVAGKLALVSAASVAPVKTVDRQKSRYITLPKPVMTLDELAHPVEQGGHRYYCCSVSVPKGMADRAVHFPARELTVGEFISAIEAQTPLRHWFSHCGNGYTILWGGDCSFRLDSRVP